MNIKNLKEKVFTGFICGFVVVQLISVGCREVFADGGREAVVLDGGTYQGYYATKQHLLSKFKLDGSGEVQKIYFGKNPESKDRQKWYIVGKEDKIAVILGNEGNGLKEETIKDSDYVSKIPMKEGVD